LIETGCYSIRTNAEAETMINLPVPYGGRFEVYSSLGDAEHESEWTYIRQRFVPFSLSYGIWERDVIRNDTNKWTYYSWKLTSSANLTLFEGSSNDSIALSAEAKLFNYLEIFYTDNNDNAGGYIKLHKPYDKPVHLSIVEAATGTATYIRRTKYTIAGTSITPDTSVGSYALISGTSVSHTNDGVNRIKITKVVGYHA
jgi:hypothetical protein